MPKVSRVGKFRQTAKAAAPSAPSKDNAATEVGTPVGGIVFRRSRRRRGGTNLSRGQKKRMAKREQYLRKERLVMASLMLKKEEEQAKRIDGLDALKAALLSTTTDDQKDDDEKQQQAPNALKTAKSRQSLLQRESNQLQLVMQHPAFQADPLATIQQHLTNSLATQAAKRQQEEVQHERQRKQEVTPKKAKRKKHRVRPTRSKA